MPRNRWQRGRITGTEGVDYVICRICGDRRRVISGRHLSKHYTDRASYMNEYKLSPDELVAKAFRVIQSCQPGFKPNSKVEWVDAIKRIYKRKVRRGSGVCRKTNRIYTLRQSGYSAVWPKAIDLSDWTLKKSGFVASMKTKECIGRYGHCDGKNSRSMRVTS